MTLRIPMNTLYRLHPDLRVIMCIPGGWEATVPEIMPRPGNEWIVDAYTTYYSATGMPPLRAAAQARLTLQQTYVQGLFKGLRDSIWRRAIEYASMYPELCIPTGQRKRNRPVVMLQGFDPKLVQQMYVPFQNTGRPGQEYVQEMLAAMGRKAKEAQNAADKRTDAGALSETSQRGD
jgi:hypothetical protein